MAGNARTAECVRIVALELQVVGGAPGGTLTTQCVTAATNREIKDCLVHFVAKLTDIFPKRPWYRAIFVKNLCMQNVMIL